MTNPYSPPQFDSRRAPAVRSSSIKAFLLWAILGAAVGLLVTQALECLQVRRIRWNFNLPLNILWCSFGAVVGMGGLAYSTGGIKENVAKSVVMNVAGAVLSFWLTALICHMLYLLVSDNLFSSMSHWKIPIFGSSIFSLAAFLRYSTNADASWFWRVTWCVMSTVPASMIFWLLYGSRYIAPSLLINICFGGSLLMFSLVIIYEWRFRPWDFWRLGPWGIGLTALLALLYLSVFGVSV